MKDSRFTLRLCPLLSDVSSIKYLKENYIRSGIFPEDRITEENIWTEEG
jgi:hypothetical protein